MNCATHSDIAAVAFCRTCGKPLCNQCTRDVRGVIYCESCLAAHIEGAPSAPGFVPPPPNVYPPIGGPSAYVPPMPPGVRGMNSGPNPTVAGILAGFFPIGVGAVYTGQYAKGLSHLGIAVLLIIVISSEVPWYVKLFLALSMGFFYVYQIIDSVRTAKALQTGEPAPDPFGLGSMFGSGPSAGPPSEKTETTKIPAAAAVLIGLGVLFLVNTAFDFSLHRYWALILIALGAYLFAKHWGLLGNYRPICVCERCRTRKLMGPAILVTLGVIFLLDSVSSIDLWKTWPAILLVIGVVKLIQSNASYNGHIGLPLGSSGYPPAPPPPTPPGAPTAFQGMAQNPAESPASSADPSSSGEVKNV
ncbi:MAG TPA: B-box zinc finger protein [Candidatus Dormibacteraeota bacterium]|nr:B-box zinc finger protein [Candidatus Dormibacteraeota bacterium]